MFSADSLQASWKPFLEAEFFKPYFKNLEDFLKKEQEQQTSIYPSEEKVFSAFEGLNFEDVKVVILGQDPYHGPSQAVGLSFAVPDTLKTKPPSLKNIFKEIENDLSVSMEDHSSELLGWRAQGILLLNTVLTVRAGEAFSHRNKGWESFTDAVICTLAKRKAPVLFVLWGAAAQKKKVLIESSKQHAVIEGVHPSPLSAHRGFIGSKPFSRANQWLEDQGYKPIDWTKT